MHTDGCGNTSGEEYHALRKRKGIKYKTFQVEILGVWKIKCIIIPVTLRATGIAT